MTLYVKHLLNGRMLVMLLAALVMLGRNSDRALESFCNGDVSRSDFSSLQIETGKTVYGTTRSINTDTWTFNIVRTDC